MHSSSGIAEVRAPAIDALACAEVRNCENRAIFHLAPPTALCLSTTRCRSMRKLPGTPTSRQSSRRGVRSPCCSLSTSPSRDSPTATGATRAGRTHSQANRIDKPLRLVAVQRASPEIGNEPVQSSTVSMPGACGLASKVANLRERLDVVAAVAEALPIRSAARDFPPNHGKGALMIRHLLRHLRPRYLPRSQEVDHLQLRCLRGPLGH